VTDQVEEAVIQYLKTRNDGWYWFMGSQRYTKEETLRRFKKDKAFREMVKSQIYRLATEMFMKAAEKTKTEKE
jgi:protease II